MNTRIGEENTIDLGSSASGPPECEIGMREKWMVHRLSIDIDASGRIEIDIHQ